MVLGSSVDSCSMVQRGCWTALLLSLTSPICWAQSPPSSATGTTMTAGTGTGATKYVVGVIGVALVLWFGMCTCFSRTDGSPYSRDDSTKGEKIPRKSKKKKLPRKGRTNSTRQSQDETSALTQSRDSHSAEFGTLSGKGTKGSTLQEKREHALATLRQLEREKLPAAMLKSLREEISNYDREIAREDEASSVGLARRLQDEEHRKTEAWEGRVGAKVRLRSHHSRPMPQPEPEPEPMLKSNLRPQPEPEPEPEPTPGKNRYASRRTGYREGDI